MIRVFSTGGGVQSTAALVLAAQGDIDFKTFLFANTGDDSENPDTLAYVREIAKPYAEAHGIELHELRRTWKDGRDWTLYGHLQQLHTRSIGIPIRMSNGAPGNRTCTEDYKIKVIAKWVKQHGATAEQKAVVGLGISLDELGRARSSSGIPWYDITYPLLDLRIDRTACTRIIANAGLAIPPKSSCWFCPFHSLQQWRTLRDTKPGLFQQAVALEARINEKRAAIGRDDVWLTDRLKPLDQAIGTARQFDLWGEEETCESGYCMV